MNRFKNLYRLVRWLKNYNIEIKKCVFVLAKETCFGLKIQKSISDYETKTLIVSGETLNGDYRFNNSKIVSMKKISDLTFIETDKPVYKPGQKGIKFKFRN